MVHVIGNLNLFNLHAPPFASFLMQLKDTSGPWRLDKDAIIFTNTMFELPSSFSSLGWGGGHPRNEPKKN